MTNKLFKTTTNSFKKSILNLFKRNAIDNESDKYYNQSGVYHDFNYISKCVRNSDINFRSNIENLNRDLLRGEKIKNAVYLAAGIDSTENLLKRYSSIKGINNLILIDYRIEKFECITVNDSFRIFNVGCEGVRSAALLEESKISINLLIECNFGANLGFGFFSLSSNQVLSAFEPLCDKNQFIFVGSYDYQKCNQQYMVARDYLNCFQYETKRRIKTNDLSGLGYEIELPNFTTYPWSSKEIDITVFHNKIHYPELSIKKEDVTLHYIKGNIFSKKNELDIMFLYFRNLFMHRQFSRTIINALDFRGVYKKRISSEVNSLEEEYNFMTSDDMVQFSNTYNVKKVGFVPLKGFDYTSYINSICGSKSEITDLYFFYFDPKDLNKIYQVDQML
ncbi:MAG: hypothetical protein VB066_10905 [Paludibacter sp.]|nr:hypothetical protein [Paludibacter sp.]